MNTTGPSLHGFYDLEPLFFRFREESGRKAGQARKWGFKGLKHIIDLEDSSRKSQAEVDELFDDFDSFDL